MILSDDTPARRRRRLPRWLRLLLGSFLVLVGLIGLVAPIMPGWVFLIPGVFLLGRDAWGNRWVFRRVLRLRRWARDKRPDYRRRHPKP